MEVQALAHYDIRRIRQIQRIQGVHQQRIQTLLREGTPECDDGFLMSQYSDEEFEDFFADGGTALVAQEGDVVLGYLLHYPGAIFMRDYGTTTVDWAIGPEVSPIRADYEAGRFSYLDQIAVAGTSRGAGRALVEHYQKTVDAPRVLSAVFTRPIMNNRSHAFFKAMGFTVPGEFYTPVLRGIKDVYSSVMHWEPTR